MPAEIPPECETVTRKLTQTVNGQVVEVEAELDLRDRPYVRSITIRGDDVVSSTVKRFRFNELFTSTAADLEVTEDDGIAEMWHIARRHGLDANLFIGRHLDLTTDTIAQRVHRLRCDGELPPCPGRGRRWR